MQTSPLPSLASGANVNGAPNRGNADSDGAQFSAALSREIGHRSEAPTPAPAPAPQAANRSNKQDARQPAAQPQHQQESAPPASEQAPAANASGTSQAGASQASGDAADDGSDAADASAQGAVPMTDMLALVASFNQMLRQGAPAAATTEAASANAVAAGASENLPQLADKLEAALPDAGAGADGPADAATRFAAVMRSSQRPAQPGGDAGAGAAGPADAATRFAAAMRSSQRPAQPGGETPSATAAPRAPTAGATDTKNAQLGAADDKLAARDDVSPSHAPSAAPDAAPNAAPAPVAALEADLKQLEAAAQRLDTAREQPASQLLAAAQVQQTAPVVAQAVAASENIAARVGTPNWDNQVGQKIVWMVAGGEQTASLTLNPPDLGPMQVVLSVNGDQASVAFSASQQEVRNALENALPRLREMMGESGIALGSATVSTGMPDQRQAQGGSGGAGGSGSRGNGGTNAVDEVQAPRVTGRTTILGDRGMVDTFA